MNKQREDSGAGERRNEDRSYSITPGGVLAELAGTLGTALPGRDNIRQRCILLSRGCQEQAREVTLVPRLSSIHQSTANPHFHLPRFRERDEDNLRAMFKPGQDALVQAELIPDDTPEHLVMGSLNVVIDRQQAPKTIIDLEEVGEALAR